MTVGFGIKPKSADPADVCHLQALAGLCIAAITAGGEFHPALRTLLRTNKCAPC